MLFVVAIVVAKIQFFFFLTSLYYTCIHTLHWFTNCNPITPAHTIIRAKQCVWIESSSVASHNKIMYIEEHIRVQETLHDVLSEMLKIHYYICAFRIFGCKHSIDDDGVGGALGDMFNIHWILFISFFFIHRWWLVGYNLIKTMIIMAKSNYNNNTTTTTKTT